jgi:membrane protease YdiL (CAAX protease family)
METKKITIKTFAVSIAAVLVAETIFGIVVPKHTHAVLTALGITRCLEAILLLLICLQSEKDLKALGLSPSTIIPGIIKGLFWSACFGLVVAVIFVILFVIGINALKLLNNPLPTTIQNIVVFFLVGGVIGPIAEEIFFRGIIYGFFRQWGIFIAIAISTLLFVFIHPVGQNLPFTQLVGGIVFAVAYEKEKSLMVPITIHSLGNMAIFSSAFLR